MTFAPLNAPAAEFNLSDVLNLLKREILLSLNCHAIATVQSFDYSSQHLTAQMNYGKTTYVRNPVNNKLEPSTQDYPLLVDCPVIFLGVTYPISSGDQVLILFNDRDIDNWIAGARSGPVATNRLHSFSDGLALVGLNKVTNFDPVRTVLGLRGGNANVAVSLNKVKIFNQLTTLNTLLQNLLTQIQALTVTCAAPGNPSSVPINAAAFASIATQIGGLLE